MLPRIVTTRPRPAHAGCDIRAYDITIVEPGHRATYTVLARNGREANERASVLFERGAAPFRMPDHVVA
jgi:hypothetical protein